MGCESGASKLLIGEKKFHFFVLITHASLTVDLFFTFPFRLVYKRVVS